MATAVKALQQPQFQIIQAASAPQTRRVPRRPQHKFNVRSKPYEIVPFMIAPVLPGETLQNLLMQSRVVSDPIQNPLIGWHKEYYFFYVKHEALVTHTGTAAGLLTSMMIDPATDISTLKRGSNETVSYSFKGGMNFVNMCLHEVINEFFRDEGEAVAVATIENYPAARIDQEGWHHSLKLEAAGADDAELPGQDELEEMDILPSKSAEYAQWELMRDHGLTDLTYEDYIRSYGVHVPKSEDSGLTPDQRHKPELIRFVREWSYPTNHVDPATGAPSSALSWSIAERADKKRFFNRPGFLFGVTVTRPKIYLGSQKGAAVGLLDNPYMWLPAVLDAHPYVSVRENAFSATDGILQNQTTDYWLDVRDLFIHGDQFTNIALTAAANHGLALPDAAGNKKYPTDAMVESLFKTAGSEYIREDGVVHLNILSRQKDTTA